MGLATFRSDKPRLLATAMTFGIMASVLAVASLWLRMDIDWTLRRSRL